MKEQRSNLGFLTTEDIQAGGHPSVTSRMIFGLICFLPVFAAILFGGVDNVTWVLISIIWALLSIIWVADSWNAGGVIVNSSSLQVPVIGLILIGLIQLLPLGGAVDGVSVQMSRALSLDPLSTRFFVIKLVIYLTFFAASLAYINSEKRLKAIVWLIIVFGSVMAFYGILQRLATPEGIYGMRETSGAIPFGPFVNQHHFATFMQMTGGLTAAILLGRDVGRERRLLLAAGLVVMGVATASTGSRGGLLGFLATLAFVGLLFVLSGRWRSENRSTKPLTGTIVVAAGGLALSVVIFGVALLIGGNDSLLRGIGATSQGVDISTGRLHFWPIALQIFWANPILGAGLESFGVAFTKYDTWSGQFRVEQAHNEYLQTLADAGIAGALCLVGFIVLLFKKGLGVISSSDGFRSEAATGALAGCLGVLIHSFFDFPLRTPSNAFFFLLLCAIATVQITSGASRHKRRSRTTEP